MKIVITKELIDVSHNPKKCGCSQKHNTISIGSKFVLDDFCSGIYFDCVCGSTLFYPKDRLLNHKSTKSLQE